MHTARQPHTHKHIHTGDHTYIHTHINAGNATMRAYVHQYRKQRMHGRTDGHACIHTYTIQTHTARQTYILRGNIHTHRQEYMQIYVHVHEHTRTQNTYIQTDRQIVMQAAPGIHACTHT